jgi:hypothetical protein
MAEKKYHMVYEDGNGSKTNPQFCVWKDAKGQEVFRIEYQIISNMREIFGAPYEIREEIIFWAQMLYNPD